MHFAPIRGFTLIELLVVIAIIGILAGIVLAALGNTRQQGADTGIKGNLNTVRTQSYIYEAGSTNGYGVQAFTTVGTNAACGSGATMWSNSTVAAATRAATAQAGIATINAVANQAAACYSSATGWFIAVVLKTNTAQVWCVDSAGKAGTTTVASITGSLTACP